MATDINDVYRQRNNLAIAFCKAALAAGWKAGRGIDHSKEPDDEWRHVVYITLPGGEQVSWHIAPSEVHLLEGIPEYGAEWDGTFLARDKNWPNLIKVPTPDPISVSRRRSGLRELVFPCNCSSCEIGIPCVQGKKWLEQDHRRL